MASKKKKKGVDLGIVHSEKEYNAHKLGVVHTAEEYDAFKARDNYRRRVEQQQEEQRRQQKERRRQQEAYKQYINSPQFTMDQKDSLVDNSRLWRADRVKQQRKAQTQAVQQYDAAIKDILERNSHAVRKAPLEQKKQEVAFQKYINSPEFDQDRKDVLADNSRVIRRERQKALNDYLFHIKDKNELMQDAQKVKQNRARQQHAREVSDIVTGQTEKGGWLSGRTQEMKRALDARTAGITRESIDKMRENGYWDKGADVQLWSTGHRADMRNAYTQAIGNYQLQEKALQKQIDETKGNRFDPKWDKVIGLYSTPEIENEKTILRGEGYTAEEKATAQETLDKLMRNANMWNFQDAAHLIADQINEGKYDEANMRRFVYDAVNGQGTYNQRTKGMDEEQKAALDKEIDAAIQYAKDNDLSKQLRNVQARIQIAEDKIGLIDRQNQWEQDYNERISAPKDNAEWNVQNVDQDEMRLWQTALAAASPDGVVSPSVYNSMQTMNVDKLYMAMNPNAEYTGDITAYDELTRNAILMNKDERDVFLSYYNNGKKNEAWAFYQGMQPMLNQAYNYYEKLSHQELARRFPVMASAMTEVAHIAQPLEAITNLPGQLNAWATGEQNAQTDPYSSAYNMTRLKTDIREQVAEDLQDWGWVYQGFMSGVDSAVNIGLARALGLNGKINVNIGGKIRQIDALQTGTLALFHTQAFETSLQNTLTKGHDDFGYDMVEAWIDAAVETLTEIATVEALLADPRNILTYVGKVAISEPSEEIVGEIFRPYINEMLGHKNEWKERAKDIYAAGGYTDANGQWVEVKDFDQATRQAMREWNHQIRMAAQEALVSVGPSMTVGGARLYFDTGRLGKSMQRTNVNGEQSAAKQLAAAGAKLDSDTYAYKLSQKMNEKLAEGKKVSNYDIGLLTRNMMEEAGERRASKARKVLEDRIYEDLNGKDLQGAETKAMDQRDAAQLVMKAVVNGMENLTQKERDAIQRNYDLYNVYKDYTYNEEKQGEVYRAQQQETKAERGAYSTADRIILEAQVSEAAGKIQLATEEEWKDAEGEEKTGGRRIVYDGKRATLGNLIEGTRVNPETNEEESGLFYQVQIDKQKDSPAKTVLLRPSEVRAITPGTAGIVFLQSSDPNFYSPMYTNRMLAMMDDNRIQNKPETLMKDGRSIRIAAFTLSELPQTQLPADVAEELYHAAQAEYMVLRQRDLKGSKALKPGEGRVTYKNAVYDDGTDAFEKAIAELPEADRQYVRDMAAFGKAYGMELGITDNAGIVTELDAETRPFKNEPHKIYGYETKNGIRVNIEGKDANGQRHIWGITLGHETVHYLQDHSMEGYDNLVRYVMGEQRKVLGEKGLQQKIEDMMRSKNLTLDKAISEIVADSCDNIFNNEEVVKHIQETNEKLYKGLRSFAKDLLTKVKNFMRGDQQQSMSQYSKNLLGRQMKEIAKLYNLAWDEAITGPKVNEKAMKKAESLYRKYNGEISEKELAKLSSAQADEFYMDAMAANNNAAMRAILDEIAQRYGYITELAYHGTPDFGFTEFDLGRGRNAIFVAFGENAAKHYSLRGNVRNISERALGDLQKMTPMQLLEEAQKWITDRRGDKVNSIELLSNGKYRISWFESDEQKNRTMEYNRREMMQEIRMTAKRAGQMNGTYQLYTRPGKQFVLDAHNNKSTEIHITGEQINTDMNTDVFNTRMIAKWAMDNGYDSVRINNVLDAGGVTTDYGIFFNQNDVKSADLVTYDDQGEVIKPTERFSEDADIRYSTANVEINGKTLQMGMNDQERYNIIKGTTIHIHDSSKLISLSELYNYNNIRQQEGFDKLRALANKYGVINKVLTNNHIKNEKMIFSTRNLKLSIHHQEENNITKKTRDYDNFAALIPVFEDTFMNAVPMDIQGDRYQYVINDDSDLETYAELLGAFSYNGKIIPVKFDLKEIKSDKTHRKLYIVATIKDAIVATTPQKSSFVTPASYTISIEDIIQNVNKDDESLLTMIPAQFLRNDQLEGKRNGLVYQGEYIKNKAERERVAKGNPITAYNLNMTEERIDREIERFSPENNNSGRKAFMAYINPQEFVEMNTVNPEQIENENRPLNGSELRNNEQTPYIVVDMADGMIVDHQGRHRMDALAKAGVQKAAILVVTDGITDVKDETIKTLNVKNKGSKLRSATLENLIPVNQEHRQELIDTYSNSDNWFRYSTAQMDEEYEQAVMDKNWTKAEQMLMDKLSQTEGIIPYRAPHGYVQGKVKNHQEIAKQIKEKYGPAIAQAVEDMAPMVPDNAALVPMPPSTGTVTTETDTYVLAQALSEATGRPVIVALDSNERESRYKAKSIDKEGVQVEDMGFRQIEEIPEDMMPVFVDNVVGKGVTAQAAHDAIGRGITLAYAKTTRGNVVKGLKSLTVTYDKKGKLIPLSKRLDINNPGVKYSMADIEPADTDSENFRNWFKNSKVVDEDGRPLIVYHGTEEDFDAFDPSRSRINMDIQGMFFSPWEIEAGGYGSKVGAYYLSIQNPAPEELAYKTLNKYKGQNEAGRKAREDLIRQGYDGVQTYDEYIAFYPGQIKSATDNNGNYDENDDRYRFSTFSEEQADVNQWMMNATASTVQTEDERQLVQAYKDLKIRMNLNLHRQMEYQRKIKALEQHADRLTTAERDDLAELYKKQAKAQQKMAEYEDELFQITSNEGYAKKMYQFNMVHRDFIAGKTQEQVRQTVEDMLKQVQAAQEQMKQDRAELLKLAQDQSVQMMKSFLGKSSLADMAAMLRKQFNSSMNKAEIQDRLAEISVKMAAKQDVTSDIETLTQDLLDKMRGIRSDNLEYIRGTTLVIGQHLVNELKAEHMTLKELRSALKGSGITLKTAEKGRFVQTWEELRENNSALPEVNNLSESDAIRTIVDYVANELSSSRGAEQYGANFDELALFVRSAAQNVTTYITGDAAARKQITSLMQQIKALSQKTEKTAEDMEKLEKQLDDVVAAGQKAAAHTSSLSMDMNNAIEYYSKTAKVAAENERTKVRKQLIEQLRSENTKRLIDQQEQFKEKMKKDKQARTLAQENLVLRQKITTNVKRLANLLTKETDLKNIPEQAKPLARQLIRMIATHDMNFRMVTFGSRAGLEGIIKTLNILGARDGAFKDSDLAWLIRGEGENADYEIHDRVWADLAAIESGLLEYANADGQGNVSLMDRKAALERVQKAVTEIYQVIRAQQMAEINGRRMYVDELAMEMYDDMGLSRFKGNRWFGAQAANVRAFLISGNTTPEYFIKNLHNGTMSFIYGDYHNAENRAGLLFQDAQDAMAQIAEETGFATWDPNKKVTIQLEKGGTVQLNVEQLMQLYATWKREQTLQAEIGSINKTFHLTTGGFYVENDQHKIGQKEIFRQRAYRMTEQDAATISNALTEQQKEYADKVVEYLTRVMGAIGNEASMRMYGIKKYSEQYYFPFERWSGVAAVKSDKGAGGSMESARGAHPSFSNRLMNNASNALMIRGFTQTAAKHIVNMINYSTFAPAIENLQKVMNTQLLTGEEDNITKRNLWAAFGEAYGKDALDYLKNFQQAINGGADRVEKTPYDKLLSTFRKSAVAGSLSVAFQQPLSYIRAIMVIDQKYLAAAMSPTNMKRGTAEEMRKYSGVAVLKKLGKFDMGLGQSGQQFVTPEGYKTKGKKAYQFVSDKSTMLPELMDELTWTRLWTAAKLEQQELNKDMDPKSEAFLQKVAERFNEIIRLTQVYDSVMVRSPNMRSTHWFVKSLTSFMAEPTLTANVLADAVVNVKDKGGKAKLIKACAAYILSAVGQAFVKGVMSAGRSPDKKKTWDENNAYKFMYNFINEINPLGLLPGYSDMITLLKKGELSDDAMGVIGKILSAGQKGLNLISGKEEDIYRGIEDSVGVVAQLITDIPFKNLLRDARAMLNMFSQAPYAKRATSGGVLKYQLKNQLFTADNLLGALNELTGSKIYNTSTAAYYDRIYEAEKNGNAGAAAGMKEYVTLTSKAKDPEGALSEALRGKAKKDPDLTGEEKARFLMDNGASADGQSDYVIEQVKAGEISAKDAVILLKEIYPGKDEDTIWWTVDRAVYKQETGEDAGSGKYYRLKRAIENGKQDDMTRTVEEMVKHGMDKKAVKDWIGKADTGYKTAYLAATGTEKDKLRLKLIKAYKAAGLTEEEAIKTINGWKPKKETK